MSAYDLVPGDISPFPTAAHWRAAIETLRSVDYPAHREDILAAARIDRLRPSTIRLLETLPERGFSGIFDVLHELRAEGQLAEGNVA